MVLGGSWFQQPKGGSGSQATKGPTSSQPPLANVAQNKLDYKGVLEQVSSDRQVASGC